MKTVVFGFYGATLDAGVTTKRWDRWRPSVAIVQHDDLPIHRLELLHTPRQDAAAAQVAADIREVAAHTEVRLHRFNVEDAWDFEAVFAALHDFARGYPFDLEREHYLVHITTGTHVVQICWYLLTESRHFPAVLLQGSPPRRGERGHSSGSYQLIDLDLSRYDKLATRFVREHEESVSFLKSGIATQNEEFNRLIAAIERVAVLSNEPMLLTGPTGAGKTQLARLLYALKQSRGMVTGPLVEVNCATLRGDGAMSALFGHVKGAFTGAARDRAGLLRSADGGILFLDEIGELGLDEQAMLLRAIEDKRFLPVGTDREAHSDFALIAGTNRALASAVAEGRFRADLLARIELWTFELPGLAQRPEDIGPNLDFELERVSSRLARRTTMNREARAAFMRFATSPEALWTSNFRDFNGAVMRMATLAPGGRIDRATVVEEIARLEGKWRASAGDEPALGVLSREQRAELDPFDVVQLQAVLRVCQQSRSLSEAGRTLFAHSRKRRKSTNDADRLRKYLARFDLHFDDVAPRRKP